MKINKHLLRILSACALFLLFGAGIGQQALAHVGYLLNEEEFLQETMAHPYVLQNALMDGSNMLMMAAVAFFLITLIIFADKFSVFKQVIKNLEEKEVDYRKIFPWMIRMSLGIALIGAASGGNLISPVIQGMPEFTFVQMLLGFFLFIGFLLDFSIILVIGLFLFALMQNPYMVGNIDFLFLAIVFFLIGEKRPGLDDLLSIPCYCFMKKFNDILPLLLRIGAGGAMIFLAVYEKFIYPGAMQAVVESYGLTAVLPVSSEMWVLSTGIIEFLIGIMILIGYRTRMTSALAFFVLSLSFFFFGENIYSHITLFASLSIIFVTGGNKWSVDYHLENHLKSSSS